MKILTNYINIIGCFLLLFYSNATTAQLGFCSGNSGAPIFTENFGTGTTNGPALPVGTTTYTYVDSAPNDGYYTVSSNTNWFGWHNTNDHTGGDTNGRMLIVNANDNTADEFYKTEITGLCENTTYEFSAWVLNLLPASGCGGSGIPINVKFQIWDDTDSNLLASGDTGVISGTTSPIWEQYGLVFTSQPGQGSVILKMINNGVGGCGNDVAIDDIVFKSCGDKIAIEDDQDASSLLVCESETPIDVGTLKTSPVTGISSTHYYQWQKSTDNVTWTDIPGATSGDYTPNPITTSTYFRAKVAEDVVNVNNNNCNSYTDVFFTKIITTPEAPTSTGDVVVCDNNLKPISVTVGVGESVNWYDAPVGGNIIEENSLDFIPESDDTYYAEAFSVEGECVSGTRTAVNYTISNSPQVFDETVLLCNNEDKILDATMQDVSYLWNTGETTASISINTPGTYSVTVTNLAGCSNVKTFTVNQILTPEIESVNSNGRSIQVKTTRSGDFEYALNEGIYQTSNVFKNTEGGYYTVRVRERNGCGEDVQTDYLHFVIPLYFTPNGDGDHDTFNLIGIETYGESEVSIFNRHGKLLKMTKNAPFSWNGMFNNEQLPSSDYWYVIRVNSHTYTGHFSLVR